MNDDKGLVALYEDVDRLKKRLALIAKLAGLVECQRCEGSGDGEHEAYGGKWVRCNCYACDGAGFQRKKD